MKVETLIASYRSEIERDKRELDGILADAKAHGYTNLDEASTKRSDALFERIDANKVKLREAEQIKADDAQYVRDSKISIPTNVTRGNGRTTSFSVSRNERTYDRGSDPNGQNFLTDLCRAQVGGDPNAWDKLNRHMQEERVERGPYLERGPGDLLSGGAGGLVVPQYLVDMTAPAIAARRPKTYSGMQNVSRQAADRSRVDEFVLSDLLTRVATALDSELINGAATGLDAVAVGAAASAQTQISGRGRGSAC